jgi:hypothetical protein
MGDGWAIKKIKTPEGIRKYKFGCAANLNHARKQLKVEKEEQRKAERGDRSKTKKLQAEERAVLRRIQKIERKERQKKEQEAKMLQKKELRDKAAVDKEARISRRKESREDKKKAKKDDQKSNKLARHALKETRSGYAYYTPCTLPKLKTITIKDLIAHEVIHHKDFDATIDNCRQKLKRMNSVPQKHDAKSHDPESPKKFSGTFAPNPNNLGSPKKNGRSEIRSMADILQPC